MTEKQGNDNISEIKTTLGQYFLQERIAQGGMAEIYKGIASDIHGIKRTVVIKKILPNIAANREYIDMLVSEAKIAVQLSHGNIAQIYDLGRSGNDYFMVMEYVNGKSLSQIHKKCLKDGQLIPLEYVLYFISEVANGLDYMHNKSDAAGRSLGIVHRDISPQNIIISYSGTVKIIDFGIAKAAFKIDPSESGVLKGKFAYMSPEQARGEEIDGRSDIFSLGVILHELSCGRRLFKDKDNKATIRNVRKAAVEPPSTYNPELPPEFDRIVMRALAKEASKRYQQAGQMSGELVKLLHLKFPDFNPASFSTFASELFGEKIPELEEEEVEHTPLLIIDQTQSAINMAAPEVMKEFMLDEGRKEEGEEGEAKAEPQDISEQPSATSPTAIALAKKLRSSVKTFVTECSKRLKHQLKHLEHIRPYLPVAAGTAAIIALLVIGWTSGLFRTWSEFISPTTITKEKPPPEPIKYATIEVDSVPRGAAIFIDDRNTGLKTPTMIKDIKGDLKPHTIGIYAEGYKFWVAPFSARPDEAIRFAPNLSAATGSLEIISEPTDASVTINGEPLGKTPFVQQEIVPNTVMTIKVEKEGHATWEGILKIMQDKASIVRVSLLRLPRKPGAMNVPPLPVEAPESATELTEPVGKGSEAAIKLREALKEPARPEKPVKPQEPARTKEAAEPARSSAEIELRPLPPEVQLMPAQPVFPKTDGTMEQWNNETPETLEHWNTGTPETSEHWNNGTPETLEHWNTGTPVTPGAPAPESRKEQMELDYK